MNAAQGSNGTGLNNQRLSVSQGILKDYALDLTAKENYNY